MNRKSLLLILVLVLIPFASQALAGDVKVITGASTPTDAIDDATVQKIFLGKTKSWPDGSPVEFVVLKSGDAHEAFLKAYISKSPSQFKTYWKKQVFTGKGKSPKSFDSEGELLSYVAAEKGVIGYISGGSEPAGVKVISEK